MKDDVISRQAAIDALMKLTPYKNKRELVNRCDASIADAEGRLGGIAECIDEIEDLPSAQPEPCEDFVKVVRCKKCRYAYCDKEFDNYWCNRMSGAFMVEAEGFCKWGR